MARLTTILDRLRLSKKNERTPSIPSSLTIAIAAPLSPVLTFDELFEKYQLPRLREQIAAYRELPEVTADGNLIATTSIDGEPNQNQNQNQVRVRSQEHPAPLASNPVWQRAEEKKAEETKDESEDEDEGWVKYKINVVELEEGVMEVVLEKVEDAEDTDKEQR